MVHVLVIDDEPAICRSFEQILAELGGLVTTASSAEQAYRCLDADVFDAIMLDIRLPGEDGLTALPKILSKSDAPVIVMTAFGDLSAAVGAVQAGAFEYVPKPFELDHILTVLDRALKRRTVPESQHDGAQAGSLHEDSLANDDELIGSSPPMQQLFRRIALAASQSAPVLITGESGVGKELVARAIHRHSAQSSGELVAVHLASVSPALMERELFGHVAGAFTGADQAQPGLVARADGGTLFLDEIGEAPPDVQVKLLRLVETGSYYRVGSVNPESSAFRLIAATNRSEEFLRESSSFRDDLYYRLSVIPLHVPPLRERQSDIPLLAEHFLRTQDSSHGPRFLNPDAVVALQRRAYPGNVRELRNVILQTSLVHSGREIRVADLPQSGKVSETAVEALRKAIRRWSCEMLQSEQESLIETARDLMEAELISAAMELTNGNRTAAARRLGIHRETLRDRLKRTKAGAERRDG